MCKKLYFEMSKILTKRSTCTSPQYKCVREVLRGTNIFCDLCKKEKIYLLKRLISSIEFFSFLHTSHDKSVSRPIFRTVVVANHGFLAPLCSLLDYRMTLGSLLGR
jgi:hypothetical protein